MDGSGVFFQLRVLLPPKSRQCSIELPVRVARSGHEIREYVDMSGPSRQKIMITIQLTQLRRMLADRNEEEGVGKNKAGRVLFHISTREPLFDIFIAG